MKQESKQTKQGPKVDICKVLGVDRVQGKQIIAQAVDAYFTCDTPEQLVESLIGEYDPNALLMGVYIGELLELNCEVV